MGRALRLLWATNTSGVYASPRSAKASGGRFVANTGGAPERGQRPHPRGARKRGAKPAQTPLTAFDKPNPPAYSTGFEHDPADESAPPDRQDGVGRDETHLSTFKPRTQAASRVPCAHGHQSRSQDPERTPRTRPQVAERLSAPRHRETDMTPPEASLDTRGTTPPAVLSCPQIITLRHRADFLRAARAKRQGTHGMLVQSRNRGDDDPTIRVGFTCSKKIGNAVARNRAKRRLRAVADAVLADLAHPGHDYVLIGRPGVTITRPFADLKNDLRYALKKLHHEQKQ